MSPESGSRLWIARIALLGGSLLLAFVAAELGLRLFRPQAMNVFDNTRDKMTVHPPGLDLYLHQFGQRVRMNSVGMRDVEHALDKPDGTVRILVLGDSFMEAIQVPFEDSFPAALRDRLARHTDLEIEVINAAVGGWGTEDQLTYLKRYGLRYAPDLVLVVMTLHNDVQDNLAPEFHRFVDGRVVERPVELFPLPTYLSLKVKAWLSSYSHVYRLAYLASGTASFRRAARALDSHVIDLFLEEPPESVRLGWAITLAMLGEIERVSAEAGARTAVLLVPIEAQLDREELDPRLAARRLLSSDLVLERPQRQVVQWAATRSLPVIDLLPTFRAWYAEHPGELYLGEGHWNAGGHALAAEVAARALRDAALVPAARR